MKPPPDWLGKAESGSLAYQRAEGLLRVEGIVRTVVAMLNAGGGRVVVGVDEHGRPEGVDDAQAALRQLGDALQSRIEPDPYAKVCAQVRLGAVEVFGREVVEIVVDGDPREVYAERRGGLFGFWTRAGAAIIPMTAAEVRQRIREGGDTAPDHVESAHGQSAQAQTAHTQTDRHKWLEKLLEAVAEDTLRLTIAFRPLVPMAVTAEERLELLEQWRSLDPAQGRRPLGFGLVLDARYSELDHGPKALRVVEAGGYRALSLGDDGSATMTFGADLLDRGALNGRPSGDLNTWTLLEGTATACRFFARLLHRDPPGPAVEWAWLLHTQPGARVRPFLPDTIGWQADWQTPFVTTASPIVFSDAAMPGRIADHPDVFAHAILTQLWERCGFDAAIPLWSARDRRFVFP